MERHRTRISLHIRHPNRPAVDLCRALPFAPGLGCRRPRTNPMGMPQPGHFAETYATFPPSDGAGPTAEAVSSAAERVVPCGDRLRAWQAEGGACEFVVGWFRECGNSGDVFEPELLGRLGALGIGLSPDISSRADTSDHLGKKQFYSISYSNILRHRLNGAAGVLHTSPARPEGGGD